MNPTLTLFYADDTFFTGQSLNGDWKKAPEKPIKEMVYVLGEKTIKLTGFKEYNHCVEIIHTITKQKSIARILLMGRNEKTSDLIVIDLKQKKVFKQTVLHGKEYNGMIITGWKEGLYIGKGVVSYA